MRKINLIIFIIFLSGKGQLPLPAETYEHNINLKPPKKGDYFPVTHDKVMVRLKPDIKSRTLIQLNTGDMIKFIKRKSRNVVVDGNEGKWVYTETEKTTGVGHNISGWVFDHYIGYPGKFLLCTDCNFKNASIENNDITYHYRFIESENFILRIEFSGKAGDDFRRKCKEAFKIKNQNCYHKGKVYKYRNFMITQSLTSGRQYFIIKNNRLYLLNFPANRCR